jgi:OOP family OmpA-OmpF porin
MTASEAGRRRSGVLALALAAALGPAGCATYDFDRVAGMEAGPAFVTGLRDRYVALARFEAEEGDWADAVYYNNKARRAGLGQDLGPQPLAERRLAPEALAEVEPLRQRLVEALAAHGGAKPVPAAQAQTQFDCWLEQLEEGHQADHIEACRAGFLAALDALDGFPASAVVLLADEDGVAGQAIVANAGETRTLGEARQGVALGGASDAPGDAFIARQEDIDRLFAGALGGLPAAPVHLVLYFETGGTELTAESAAKLPRLIEILKGRAAPEVEVVGHTDTVGPNPVNVRLARERAALVRDRIAEIGLDPARIAVSSHGENNPVVPTADEVAEPRNRRVEIVVR